MTGAKETDPAGWVERYGDILFRYAMLRVRDRSAAEDLVQETFLAGIAGRGSFSGGSSESTWLVGILKHKIADHFRRLSRESPRKEEPQDVPDADDFDGSGHWTAGPGDWGGNPVDLLRQEEFLETFGECLGGLPPNQAAAFTLREIDGKTTGEICKVLDVTETNLWVILHRARTLLRRCLETRWLTRETG